jgi:hypothetical protein
MVDPAPVVRAAQSRLELLVGRVQRGVAVLGGRLGAYDGAPRVDRQLDTLTQVGLPWVALPGQLDIDADHLRVELLDLRELLRDLLAEPLGDLGMPTLDDDVHVGTLPVG